MHYRLISLAAVVLFAVAAPVFAAPQAAPASVSSVSGPPPIVSGDQIQAPSITTVTSDGSAAAAPSVPAPTGDQSFQVAPAALAGPQGANPGSMDRPSALSDNAAPMSTGYRAPDRTAQSMRQVEEDESPDRPSALTSATPSQPTNLSATRPSAIGSTAVTSATGIDAKHEPLQAQPPTLQATPLSQTLPTNPSTVSVTPSNPGASHPSLPVPVEMTLSPVPVNVPVDRMKLAINPIRMRDLPISISKVEASSVAMAPDLAPIVIPATNPLAGLTRPEVKISVAKPSLISVQAIAVPSLDLISPGTAITTTPASDVFPNASRPSPSTARSSEIAVTSPSKAHARTIRRRVSDISDIAEQVKRVNQRLAAVRLEVQGLQEEVVGQEALAASYAKKLADKDREIADLEQELRILHSTPAVVARVPD